MIEVAVNTILTKAWDNNSQALIYFDNSTKLAIQKDNYRWQTYKELNVLCIYNKQENIETYYDLSSIYNITLVFNEWTTKKKKRIERRT